MSYYVFCCYSVLIGVGVSCRISCSVFSYLYIDYLGWGREREREREKERAIFLLSSTCNYVVSVPLGASDKLRFFIMALSGPSI